MSDAAEESKKTTAGAWIAWGAGVLLLYILSPIPVLIPIGYWNPQLELQLEETVYAPLVFLCEHSDTVSMFYQIQGEGVEWMLEKLGG
ncbi:hypothetical protein [Rubinisphaera margarita]|uniref:hypothetical protein n=1 Tax=Rubinisphaera margarita TaxID=2909586 RepID=UPI001EE987FE|nr:hypothetical protein [Rubinisphaera margarita]MCG6154227.1 hypothetical protein [Rubinisphaera margarita]